MTKIIALTGATGFIGSTLAYRLRKAGLGIRALIRPSSNRDHLKDLGIQWVTGGLDDPESLCRLVGNVFAVVHCAGAVRGASDDYFFRINSHGTARLVQAASKENPKPCFLYISSLAAREPRLSPYAASKKRGEEALAAGSKGMLWAALRPPPVYGPGDREMLPLFQWMYRGIAPVYGPADARFSMLYVEDLAEAIVHWLARGSRPGQIFELHDGQTGGYCRDDLISTIARIREKPVYRVPVPLFLLNGLARMNAFVAKLTGYAPMLTPGKMNELMHSDWTCDNTLLSRETGWTPKILLKNGLRQILKPDKDAQ
ncbi:MAG: NAD-dependent epimerase/dehydratase family protein [Dissulfuribacterales bacterium]